MLIVVDYQNDFVTGSLGFEEARSIGPAIASKIRERRALGDEVVFTMDTHHEDYLDTLEGRRLPVPHTLRGTKGWRLCPVAERERKPGDLVFEKTTFGSTALFEFLRRRDYGRIELCGVVTDICVLANAVLARTACPDALVLIDPKAVASNDPARGEAALQALRSLQVDIG